MLSKSVLGRGAVLSARWCAAPHSGSKYSRRRGVRRRAYDAWPRRVRTAGFLCSGTTPLYREAQSVQPCPTPYVCAARPQVLLHFPLAGRVLSRGGGALEVSFKTWTGLGAEACLVRVGVSSKSVLGRGAVRERVVALSARARRRRSPVHGGVSLQAVSARRGLVARRVRAGLM